MLNKTTNLISSAFHQSFIKRLSQYLHDCVREEVKSATFRNLEQDKDNRWFFLSEEFESEQLFSNFPKSQMLDGLNTDITELLIQSEMNQKDKYLIYGFMFLEGKSSQNKKSSFEFLTPLLYMPIKLEREDKFIKCTLLDENLSLNTSALATLLNKTDDEDETEQMLFGLLDVLPQLPLTREKLEIFLTTLKSLASDLEISENLLKIGNKENSPNINSIVENINIQADLNQSENENQESLTVDLKKIKSLQLSAKSALILTKRPSVTAGVLHELTKISETPSGIFRETALGIINEEFQEGKMHTSGLKHKNEKKEFYPITPLNLSDAQEDVLRKIEENNLLCVFGPPGTGKSQTIVNLVCHLVANGKKVLVASRMDKAVDVVTERLNSFNAPFLALRAGRTNYQKKLNIQLEELLSNKVDLKNGFEDCVLLENKDMKTLLDKIENLNEKCEKIIKLETKWAQQFEETSEMKKNLGEIEYLKTNLPQEKIKNLQKIVDTIEKNNEKAGILKPVSNFFSLMFLKKFLNKNNLKIENINFERLKLELEYQKLSCALVQIENEIFKTGNFEILNNEKKRLQKTRSKLAIDLLKKQRVGALESLLQDCVKTRRLKIHSKAIVERKKNLQNRLLEDEDFSPLLEAFPCWGVTTYAISESLPLKPGMFDVAIIDEASQCDIASCFPILFRAKKAVVVGDDKQLAHLSFLEKTKEQSYLTKYEIPDKYQLMFRFRTNSMFDLANYYSTSQVLLDEHFRSLPPIINFSNKHFYSSRIKVMNNSISNNGVLELETVENAKIINGITRNDVEVEAVVKKLYQIILEDEKNSKHVSIGIISPFRAQVEALEKAVSLVLSLDLIKRHKIEIGTAHTFQGDEKDIIMISWAIAPNSFFQSMTFLQKPNLFNVAITRARKKVISFVSKPVSSIQKGLFRDYLEYIEAYKNASALENQIEFESYKNDFEKEVAYFLRENGFKVKPGFETASQSCDLLVTNEKNENFIVEVDGIEDDQPLKISNMKKQELIERSGFKVVRFSFRQFKQSKNACIERIK